jgi:hypothetical protein
MRMAYVMGFGLSITASTIARIKKPFNPLLGETYELVDDKKGTYNIIYIIIINIIYTSYKII